MDHWNRHCSGCSAVCHAFRLAVDLPRRLWHDGSWIWLWHAYAYDGLWRYAFRDVLHVAHSARYFDPDRAGYCLARQATDREKLIVLESPTATLFLLERGCFKFKKNSEDRSDPACS